MSNQTSQTKLLDHHLGDGQDGLWATRRLKHKQGAARVLIYSAFARACYGVT